LVVPIMAIAYLMLAFWVMINNIERLPDVFLLIIKHAFGLQEVISGAFGYSTAQAITQGIQRGLFSNEAGMGSAPNVAAAASPYPPHPVSQGYMQMLGVFIDTLVICSATAIIIISSGALDNSDSIISGIELTQKAFSLAVGDWSEIFIAIAIFFFSFTSIIANYSYAESNIVFLKKKIYLELYILKFATLGMIIFGSIAEMPLVWKLADISMGLMTLINLISILMLSGIVFKLNKDYNQQRNVGKLPTFDINAYPYIKKNVKDDNIWKK
ncbi:MAG: alanine/glycine:cation symporter family protein, partial [Arsenophonus sp. ER-QC15-MAG3]